MMQNYRLSVSTSHHSVQPCPPSPPNAAAAAAADQPRFPVADGGLITHRALAFTISPPAYLPTLTFWQHHIFPPLKALPTDHTSSISVCLTNPRQSRQIDLSRKKIYVKLGKLHFLQKCRVNAYF